MTGDRAQLTLYPAIDLKDGHCVRLYKGDMNRATVFGDDPAAQARAFATAGCRWLHVVDLDGAFAGKPANAAAVEAIIAAVDIPVQLGGGLRRMDTIEAWLDKGVARVVLGTAAVRDPDLVRAACRAYPGRIAVGIDARAGRVATAGWAETSNITAARLARKIAAAGVAAIVFTDIDRDGTLEGVNAAAVAALADSVDIPVIASGGVAGPEDLDDVAAAAARTRGQIDGVIVGRALYDGRLTVAGALARLGARPC